MVYLGKTTLSDESFAARNLTLGQAVRQRVQEYPDNPAIVSQKFAPLTYSELQSQLDEVRSQLRQAGFDRNARIGVLLPSGPQAVLAIVAISCCAVAVPFDPRLTASELGQRLAVLRLDAILVPQGSASEVVQVCDGRRLTIIEAIPADGDKLDLKLMVPASGVAASSEEPDPDAPAFILQTSGTTAQPKLIPFSHSNMLAAALRLQAWFKLTPKDRCLNVSPPFYSHGLKVTVFTPLLTGGSIALPANTHSVELSEWFDALRPTWYSAGPALHRAVLDKAELIEDATATHTLRFIVSGGAPLPVEVQQGLQRTLGVPVLEHYGSSEAAQIAANLPSPGPNKPGTCGMPWPGTLIVVGEDGEPLRSGEKGEVWVRGLTLMSGYLDNPELNRSAFVDGWFRTGDMGCLDEDGFLTLHGRLSDLINRGGEKISPSEIDDALMRHPAVAEAAAFPVPHPRLGEDVAAAVVVRPGATATPAELRLFLQQSLASYKIPHRILILEQLPKGMTGKVQRRRLRETVGEQMSGAQVKAPPASPPQPDQLGIELLTLWRRLLKSDTISIDDDFFESGGDSLLATEMLIETERLIGAKIPETILLEAATIREFLATVTGQMPLAPRPMVHFHPDESRTPLIFFHGDFTSGGRYVRHMLRLLGTNQPVVAIAPHGLCGESIPQTIEEMALDRLPLILAEQSQGPFRLGGHCNGALVAFEVARLLTRAGHKVELIAMIDPPTVNARPAMRALLAVLKRTVSLRRLGWAYDHMARLERALKMSPTRLLAKTRQALTDEEFSFPKLSWQEAYNTAMARYRPAPLNVPAVFYAAAHDGRAWERLSPDLEIVELPGGHTECLTVHVNLLVDNLRQHLAGPERQSA